VGDTWIAPGTYRPLSSSTRFGAARPTGSTGGATTLAGGGTDGPVVGIGADAGGRWPGSAGIEDGGAGRAVFSCGPTPVPCTAGAAGACCNACADAGAIANDNSADIVAKATMRIMSPSGI